MTEKNALILLKKNFQFESYQITNNGAEIRRLKERLTQLRREQSRGEVPDEIINGVILRENRDENRLQLLYNGKPDDETIAKLKSHGFHFSPTHRAWQRLLNENARSAAKRVLGPAISEPPPPPEPEKFLQPVIKRRAGNLFAQMVA